MVSKGEGNIELLTVRIFPFDMGGNTIARMRRTCCSAYVAVVVLDAEYSLSEKRSFGRFSVYFCVLIGVNDELASCIHRTQGNITETRSSYTIEDAQTTRTNPQPWILRHARVSF